VVASLAACLIGSLAAAADSPPPSTAAAPAAAPAGAVPAAGQSRGAWQQHKYQFNFMGFTTAYSCDGLRDKLRLLLRLSGAAPDMKINAQCARGGGRPDKLAMAYLTFSTLQPTDGQAGTVNGEWRRVALAPQRPFDLGRGDCELVEQFGDNVLPMFSTRNVQNSVTCVPHQYSGSDFRLSYEVFAPVKAPKHGAS
jgi:hypothetical protein